MQNGAVREYYEILSGKKFSLFLKRTFDVAAALFLLILLLPAMLLIALWIVLDSRGPVFFRQERVTRYGKTFRIYKFRTMVTGAEKLGTQVTVGHDPRVTRSGRFLRKCRLDELPQLINVLLGDMTFVGTRPEVVRYVAQYTPEMYATLLLPAGVTSRTSIAYQDEETLLFDADDPDSVYVRTILPEKMKINLASLRNFSLREDFSVLMQTVFSVFLKRRGG